MSGFEIERKFLVRGDDYKRQAYGHSHIKQGYICSGRGRTVRVRLRDDRGFLTIKGPSTNGGLSRYEFEKEITLDEAEHLFALCEPGIIDKTRWLVKSGIHTFEVDEFHGDNDGLVMAEVELGAEEHKAKDATEEESISAEELAARKKKHERAFKRSFFFILASTFMWFMGYNAISSNLSVYCTKVLNQSAGVASIISGVSMAVSAIAFIPVGILAVKIGRRKSVLLGFSLAAVSFVLVFLFVRPDHMAKYLFAIFYLISGFGLIITNVNTFPMVLELSSSSSVGKYTGYYYISTMSAQAITPFISGLVMDYFEDQYLFLYSAVCVVIAFVFMFFTRYGDSKPVPAKSALEYLGAGDD